jgi:adenylylsulfate kinase
MVPDEMIWWITGNSGSGKSTLAKKMTNAMWLDGDAMRGCWSLGFSREDRFENNLRIAKIAKVIHEQGHDVVVSTICPFKELRDAVQKITGCRFVYLDGGDERGLTYEI